MQFWRKASSGYSYLTLWGFPLISTARGWIGRSERKANYCRSLSAVWALELAWESIDVPA